MDNKIKARIEKLKEENETLQAAKQELLRNIAEIDHRMAQIAGGLYELDALTE